MKNFNIFVIVVFLLLGAVQVFYSIRFLPDFEILESYLEIADREELINDVIAETRMRRSILLGMFFCGSTIIFLSSIVIFASRQRDRS